ncbi:CBO0543 family protein [Bacillus sp. Au-Bac7]|uniref:CBO0543 family protein n=1 Tax=Bacillus sp. Au-Bac7 TaxID=2906458 RepID=UPI001E3370E8|nr:CBO0543 family protein [Bacillus sp. Au-Bac7]MCE4047716.1 hypothetical protein [Bacillus sp. Au-Bac7]
MHKEFWILMIIWAVVPIIIFLNIRNSNKRVAQITFLFSQSIAWLYEFVQIKMQLVAFPYREFPYATKLSFTLHYLLFPTIGMLFILYYPKKGRYVKTLFYFLLFGTIAPTYSVIVERTTSLVEYHHWNWALGFVSSIIMLSILKVFVFWFEKGMLMREE